MLFHIGLKLLLKNLLVLQLIGLLSHLLLFPFLLVVLILFLFKILNKLFLALMKML